MVELAKLPLTKDRCNNLPNSILKKFNPEMFKDQDLKNSSNHDGNDTLDIDMDSLTPK